MARRSAARRTTSRAMVVRPIHMSAPRPIVIRQTRAVTKPKHHRRSATREGGEKHRMGAILAGFVLGLIDKSTMNIPTVPLLGRAGTLGVAAWAFGKWGRSPWANHAATGLLSIAAYELAKEGAIEGMHGY